MSVLIPSVSGLIVTTLVAAFVFIFAKIASFFYNLHRISKAVSQFPHDPKHWLLGHIGKFPGMDDRGLEFLREKTSRQPRVAAVWRTCFAPSLTLRHPDTIRDVIRRSDPKPLSHPLYSYGLPWLGGGLIFSNGHKWLRNRRLLTPAFFFDILKTYQQIDNDGCDVFMEKVDKYANCEESMEMYNNISLLTLDILMRCALSYSYDNDIQLKGETHLYVQAMGELADLWASRYTKLYGISDFIWLRTADGKRFLKWCDYVHSVADDVISKRKMALENEGEDGVRSKGKYLDFLDILLMARDDNGQGLTDREMRDEVNTFMFAGHDTTASSLTWTFYCLAQHPEFQEKCRQEADEVMGNREYVEWDDLGKFRYITQCIKEAQRRHPVVGSIGRTLAEDTIIDGKKVPAGTTVEIQILTLHQNPTVWKDPLEYRPDRFSPENIAELDAYAFIPFSAGPRNCIGQNFSMQEQKTIVARTLRKYKFELDPDFKLETAIGLVIRPKNGLKLRVSYRGS